VISTPAPGRYGRPGDTPRVRKARPAPPPKMPPAVSGRLGAVRRWGEHGRILRFDSLDIDSGDQAPFGSVMWRERARLVHYLRAADSPNPSRMPVAFFARKNNLGPLPPAVGMTLTFEEDGGPIAIARSSVTDSTDLAGRLPLRVRIHAALRAGSRSYAEIADEIDADVEVVRKTMGRYRDEYARVVGPDGITRWGLAA
jgi:hypothetical protein